MYTAGMLRLKKPLAVVVSVSLLMLQLSGAHVHASESGYIGAPKVSYHHTHEHSQDAAHHHDDATGNPERDHEDMRDVSLLDPALSTFKMPLALLVILILFAVAPVFRVLATAEFVCRVLSGRYTRWRPPLRAPPLYA